MESTGKQDSPNIQNYKWRDFGKIEKGKALVDYLNGREWNHGSYCHYTKLDSINIILGSRTFRISNITRFNDIKDQEQFLPNQKRFYSMCFSTGVNENLALWYMYAGMDGRGGRFMFTSRQIKRMLKNAVYTLCETDKDNKEKNNPVLLVEGESMRVTFGDVIYRHEKGDKVELKYNTMTNYGLSKAEYKKAKAELFGREKGIAWYYEKETRLIVEIIGDAAKSIDPAKHYFVEMTIPDDVYKAMKISLAPEISERDISKILNDYENIRKFVQSTSKLSFSEYSGSIEMNLCAKCNNSTNNK